MLKIGQSVSPGRAISAPRRRRPGPPRAALRGEKTTPPFRPAVSQKAFGHPRAVRARRAPAGPCRETHSGRFSAQRRSFSCREIHSGRFSAHPAMCVRGAGSHVEPAGAGPRRRSRQAPRGGRAPWRRARGAPPTCLRGPGPLPRAAGQCTFFGLLYLGGSSEGGAVHLFRTFARLGRRFAAAGPPAAATVEGPRAGPT